MWKGKEEWSDLVGSEYRRRAEGEKISGVGRGGMRKEEKIWGE